MQGLLIKSLTRDVNKWNTSNVDDYGSDMFSGAIAFNNGGKASISSWNTSKCKRLCIDMFNGASAFDKPLDTPGMG